jgi:Na+-driven multidrug efflux pump
MLGGNGGYTPGSSNLNTFSSSNSGVPKLSLVGIVSWLASLMNQLIYVIIGAALVAFLFGILKLSFFDGKKPEAREQARKFMFWGIVSLFVMVSVWGLVKILQSSFFNSGDLIVPRLK